MNCMRHSSTCYDLRGAAPFGIAYLGSVAFVRGHGCFLLSLMAVFRAHVFFSDNRREASKMTERQKDVRTGSAFLGSGERHSRGKRNNTMAMQLLARFI